MKQPDDPEVAAWLGNATEDLRVAEILGPHAATLSAAICFHCQQAAEKSLKAVFVALDLVPPRTHHLDTLLASLLPQAASLAEVRESLTYLNGFAVLPRYPAFEGTGAEPVAKAARACEHARLVERAVAAFLGPATGG
jgi:HEPN domain-containing protein